MDDIFMNSKHHSSKCNIHRLLINLLDKTNLRRGDKYLTLSFLSICYTSGKIQKVIQKQQI